MAYWAATRLEANRERVAQRLLEQAGYEVYLPLVRWPTRRLVAGEIRYRAFTGCPVPRLGGRRICA